MRGIMPAAGATIATDAGTLEGGNLGLHCDQNTDESRICYNIIITAFTAISIRWRLSTDGMPSWGGENSYTVTDREYRGSSVCDPSIGGDGGWFISVIIDDANANSWVNTDNAVDITSSEENPSATGGVVTQRFLLLLEG